MQNRVYSRQFDDIYFSPEDGLAESEFVFFAGNELSQRWAALSDAEQAEWAQGGIFTIAETGFGTGLNFLLACKMFSEAVPRGAHLHFISVEKYPLTAAEIREALLCWRAELSPYLERLCDFYPLRVPGFHRIEIAGNISLTLIFDDVGVALPQLVAPQGVDAWFLDGFAPSKNPDMWTEELFTQMARLSHKRTSFATFTAAGFVKRGLKAAGFEVEKVAGYGRKRERLVGRFSGGEGAEGAEGDLPEKEKIAKARPRVAVIGGGLAGTACAYALKGRADITLYEAGESLASGASGNKIGLVNPRFTAQRDASSDFYAAAYAGVLRILAQLSADGHAIDYTPCGTLHLITSDDKEKRFKALAESWGWTPEHLQILDARQATEIAGVTVNGAALYLPDSCYVSPQKLCAAYAAESGANVKTGDVVDLIELCANGWRVTTKDRKSEEFDTVILACGAAVTKFAPLEWLPVHTVRGQVSHAQASEESAKLRCNICYGGYISAPQDGLHMLGSTFQKWLTDTDIRAEDNADNIEKLRAVLPELAEGIDIVNAKAGLRTAAHDRFPIAGRVPDLESYKYKGMADKNLPGLYISTAHGSHGIVSSLMAAKMIADDILQEPFSLASETCKALSGARFLERDRKKGHL